MYFLSNLAAGVGNRRVISYGGPKHHEKFDFCMGVCRIASISRKKLPQFLFPIQNAFDHVTVFYNALWGEDSQIVRT